VNPNLAHRTDFLQSPADALQQTGAHLRVALDDPGRQQLPRQYLFAGLDTQPLQAQSGADPEALPGADLQITGDTITLKFPAKSGKVASYSLADEKLAAAIAKIKTIPGRRLLMYRGEDGVTHTLRTEELNRYLRSISGSPVTAKDFRTLHASALAAEALAKLEPGASASARKRQVAGVAKSVAAFLRNTPAITRKTLHSRTISNRL